MKISRLAIFISLALSLASPLTLADGSQAYRGAQIGTGTEKGTSLDVTGNVENQPFNIQQDPNNQSYQFNNKTTLPMHITVTVDATSAHSVMVQCRHYDQVGNALEQFVVTPGTTSPVCSTMDAMRIVALDSDSLPASGTYTITIA